MELVHKRAEKDRRRALDVHQSHILMGAALAQAYGAYEDDSIQIGVEVMDKLPDNPSPMQTRIVIEEIRERAVDALMSYAEDKDVSGRFYWALGVRNAARKT